jgi:DNA-binding winged helix-turn-helix (wHTH) protein/Tfp pilus assembly protein PilF
MPTSRPERVRFGVFEADLRAGELYKHGRRVFLHQQPFQVLALLLERPGELVTREELRRTLWSPDTFVHFDSGLNSAVRKLRSALHDSADSPRYVETLQRRGYRFIAPVDREVSQPPPETLRPRFAWRRGLIAAATFAALVALAALNVGNWQQKIQARAEPVRVNVVDPQTYELYMRGRFFSGKITGDSQRKAVDYFQQAIRRRPDYALARTALAEAYVTLGNLEEASPQETFVRAKAAAAAALQLDDTLAEAHTVLAGCLFWYDWNWAAAEKEFQRALALDPNNATAHQWYGQYEKAMGRKAWSDEAKRAGELDPLSIINAGGAWYLEHGQYDQAIALLRRKLELDPDGPFTNRLLGRAYLIKGAHEDAITYLQKAADASGGSPGFLSLLGYAYGVSGRQADATRVLHQLEQDSARRYVSPYLMAVVYAGLGDTDDRDRAFEWLDKAFAGRVPGLVVLNFRPSEMDRLRPDPRFAELKRRMAFPD